MKTLLLDRTAWDLVLDTNGNIACASDPYSIAQDVASAVKTFLGECWYDATQGLPYWQSILGQLPPASFVQAKIVTAAMSVQNVASASVTNLGFSNRVLSGDIEVTDITGNTSTVTF